MDIFRFRLSTILKLRQQHRDQRRDELMQALAAENLLLAEEKRIAEEEQRLKQALRIQTQEGPLEVDAVLGWRRYEMVLAARRLALKERLEMVRAEIERRREALIEANRELRTLELLRDRQLEQFKKEQQRHEMKLIDEIANRQAGHRNESCCE